MFCVLDDVITHIVRCAKREKSVWRVSRLEITQKQFVIEKNQALINEK